MAATPQDGKMQLVAATCRLCPSYGHSLPILVYQAKFLVFKDGILLPVNRTLKFLPCTAVLSVVVMFKWYFSFRLCLPV
jgi:hypothetical protein